MNKKEIQVFQKRLNRNKVPSKNMIHYPEREDSASNNAYADALDKYDDDVENEEVRFEPLITAHQQVNETIYDEFSSKMRLEFGWNKLSSETLEMIMVHVREKAINYKLSSLYAAAKAENEYITVIMAAHQYSNP